MKKIFNIFKNQKVVVTGYTGFKGLWLTLSTSIKHVSDWYKFYYSCDKVLSLKQIVFYLNTLDAKPKIKK